MKQAFESFTNMIVAWLDKITEDLKGYPDSQYWIGYDAGMRDGEIKSNNKKEK